MNRLAHNGNCASAKGRVCKCGGCGGSQHGWSGWVGIATRPPADRLALAQKLDKQYLDSRQAHRRPTKAAKRAAADLARLDIADWLARQPGPAGASQASAPPTRTTASEAGTKGHDVQADVDATRVHANSQDGTTEKSTAVAEFEAFAHAVAEAPWQSISAELGDDKLARAAKQQLAQHGWCDLLVGVVMAIEKFGKVIDKIPDRATAFICRVVLRSTMHKKRPEVDQKVVGLVVAKVWGAVKTVAAAKAPIFAAITGDGVLRMLRMLAVFSCPAPEDHPEVREHALEPLGDELLGIVTEEAKRRLREVFDL